MSGAVLRAGLLVVLLAGCDRSASGRSDPPAISHVVRATETIRGGDDGAYRLRLEVARYPASQAEFDQVAHAAVAQFRRERPACVVHLHVYGPGVSPTTFSDVGNATWGPPDGLGLGDCRMSTARGFRRLEFLGTVPTIASTLRFGTARHAETVPLPEGARRVRGFRNRNGQYATYVLPGVGEADLLSLYRTGMPTRGWTLIGIHGRHGVAFFQGRALGGVEWKPDSLVVGYEPEGAPEE